MKHLIPLIGVIATYLLSSCGQSSEQKALADKQRTDSIIIATKDSVKRAIEDSIKISNGVSALLQTKSLVKNAIPFVESKVEESKIAQTNADAQMANIESFHFLRSVQDKQSQVSNEVKVQQSINDRLEALETVEKIFRLAYDEMDGIEGKRFHSYSEFESFKNELTKRVRDIERKTIDESNSATQLEKFDFSKTIKDENFAAEVNDYKRLHPAQ